MDNQSPLIGDYYLHCLERHFCVKVVHPKIVHVIIQSTFSIQMTLGAMAD